ncbi:HdeD family acid-resistance protein [Actinoplanes solisilvae]|uniref:HdeD family acid-resistance protein n=1 Tax=Actinoplanes solisilvae TaxID=2486853 RepID=UPI000FDBA7DF|nr:DUF308 domain-containing protein [Actinoplanes solisilvae]
MTASAPLTPETYPIGARVDSPVAPVAVVDVTERSAWWLALTAAVSGVAVGVLMIVWPQVTLRVVAVLFGLWLLVHGAVRLARAIAGRGRDGGERALAGVIGLFFVVAGVVALRNLLLSLTLIVTLIGLMWLIGGLVELVSAFGGARGAYRVWSVALGALSVIAGIVVLAWPGLSLKTLVYVTGGWLVVMGLLQVGLLVLAGRETTATA